MLDTHSPRRRHPCFWMSIVAKRDSGYHHCASSVRGAAPSSWRCPSNVETMTSNWLRVFKRANPAHLCSGHTPERETGPLPSEKCVARCGSEYDEIRMSTVRFARVLERCTGHLYRHFLLTFQEVRLVRKTCNQLTQSPTMIGVANGSPSPPLD